MKYQFLITLAAVAASVLTAQAQVTFQSSGGQTTFKKDSSVKSGSYTINRSVKPPVYILPNGQLVPDNKVDSVAKAWNGLTMQRDLTKNPVEIRLYPITSQAAKELAASKIKQEGDLHRRLIGRPAPDFTLTDINNKVWHLSDLKGKIVVLNFWFTECQPCVAEMPTLNELKKKYTGAGIIFLAPALNDKQDVVAFLRLRQFNYDILPDAKDVSKNYNVSAWPTHMVIDKNGIVKFVQIGGKDIAKKLSKVINHVL